MPDQPRRPSIAARASLAFIGLMWVIPFLIPYHRYPLTAFYPEWAAFALGLLALSVAWRDWVRGLAAPPRIILLPAGLGLLLLVHLAAGKSPYPEQPLTALLYVLWAAALLVLGRRLRNDLGLGRLSAALACFLLAGGLLGALFALVQYYEFRSVLDPLVARWLGGGVYGNLAQPNHFANYTSLALGSLIYLYGVGRLSRGPAVGLAAPLLYVLALSGSRSAILFVAAFLILAAVFRRAQRTAETERLVRGALWMAAGFALAHVLVQLPWLAGREPGITSGERLFDTARGTRIRGLLWYEAWLMFLKAPLLGVGFGQFPWHHFELVSTGTVPQLAGGPLFHQAHNLVLHLMAELGIAAPALLVGLAGGWLMRSVRAGRAEPARWWLLAMLGVLAIHSMLEFPLWHAFFLGIAAVLLGAGETQDLSMGLRRLAVPAGAAMLVFGWWSAASFISGYRDLEIVTTRGVPAQSDRSGIKRFTDQLMAIHGSSLVAPYIELVFARTIVPDAESLDAKLALNRRVMGFVPMSDLVYRDALLRALQGDQEGAQRQLEQAIAAYPHDLPGVIEVLQRLSGRHPEAIGPLLELATRKLEEPRIEVRSG